MLISNLFPNPVELYRAIKKQIPSLKLQNKEIMNKFHSLKKSEDFWWALTGEYALLAYLLELLSIKDDRIINDLLNSDKDILVIKRLTSVFNKLISRDLISGFILENVNSKEKLQSINELLIDDEKEHFIINHSQVINKKISLPFNFLTNVLYIFKFVKINITSILVKIQKKFIQFFLKKNDKLRFIQSLKDSRFQFILLEILPQKFKSELPLWFIFLCSKFISKKYKCITRFGLELNIYQNIIIATSYDKYGEKNIEVISHGDAIGHLDLWYLYVFSLFPSIKFYSLNPTINFKYCKSSEKKGILLCSYNYIWLPAIFSLNHFQRFMNVYKNVINILFEGVKDGKNIKIRYKNFEYLRGTAGQFYHQESKIPVEEKNFEEIYNQYSMIISIPHGTIAEVCREYNLPFISYLQPFNPIDKNSYFDLIKDKRIFTEEITFLDELKQIVKNLPADISKT